MIVQVISAHVFSLVFEDITHRNKAYLQDFFKAVLNCSCQNVKKTTTLFAREYSLTELHCYVDLKKGKWSQSLSQERDLLTFFFQW